MDLTPPRPDFELKVTPPSRALSPGRSAAARVHALRKDGFEGPIEVTLVDSMKGFTLAGGNIPSDRTSVQMTVTAAQDMKPGITELKLAGHARIGGEVVTYEAVPAQNQMQAFL